MTSTHPALLFRDTAGRQWHTIITGREILHLERLLKIKILNLIDTESEESKRLSYADKLELLLELIRPQMAGQIWMRNGERTVGVSDLEFLEALGSAEICQAWLALYAGLLHFAQPSPAALDNLVRATTFVRKTIRKAGDQAEEQIKSILEAATLETATELSTTGCSGSSGNTPPSAVSSPGITPFATSSARPCTPPESPEKGFDSPEKVCPEMSPPLDRLD